MVMVTSALLTTTSAIAPAAWALAALAVKAQAPRSAMAMAPVREVDQRVAAQVGFAAPSR
jgi:hypothetical protein